MIVCSCNVMTDDEVRTVARTMTRRTIREIMDDELDQRK
jgi:bacterioferritin-associated ferredoxin